MELKTPDRVPLMCQMSIGHMLQQLPVSPVEFWFDADTFAAGLVELRKVYGFDGILVSLHGHFRNWREKILSRKVVANGEEVVLVNGKRILFTNNELPQNLIEQAAHQKSKAPTDDSLTSTLELNRLPDEIDFIPVSQGLHFDIDPGDKFRCIENIVSSSGNEFSIHGEITSPFDYFLDFSGHQEGLFALIAEPDKAQKSLDHFTTLLEKLAEEMCKTGIDAIKISSPFAGSGFISPEFYGEFVAPYDGRLARAIRTKGVHAYIHTCGAIGDRLSMMFDLGASGIECLDPPPLGNVELETAMRIANRRGFIKGNIDSVNILSNGTEEEILADARTRLDIGKKYGGFILSTACSIAPMVKRESIVLLREAVERWGWI